MIRADVVVIVSRVYPNNAEVMGSNSFDELTLFSGFLKPVEDLSKMRGKRLN